MMTRIVVAHAPVHDSVASPEGPQQRWAQLRVPALLLAESLALLLQAIAAQLSRSGRETWGLAFTFAAVALAFAWPMGVLVAPSLTRAARTAAVLALGVVSTLQWRATDPLLFTGFDEQLHVRTLVDITTSHTLGQPNPLLQVSPHYPGLEAVAALLEQLGLPLMVAATITILLARVVLVLVLSRAVEDLTGNVRAAGVAVAVYATSQQFFFFNSQFAYQTLAVPLALAAVACTARARRAADPRPAMWGASICIATVTLTHHVTSALLTVFLVAWAIGSGRREGARPLRLAALVAVVAMAVWSATQWTALVPYFGPVVQSFFSELAGLGLRSQAFSDPSGVTTPLWERVAILYDAGATSLLTVWVAFPRLRETRLGRFLLRRWPRSGGLRPNVLIVVLALVVPVTFAASTLPQVAELSNRGTTFVFLPLALLVGIQIARLRAVSHPASRWTSRAALSAVVLLTTGLYVGGIVLGDGPDWERLPGQWLASAENRSMDSETLAAVRWGAGNIRPGSRIAADRISGDLLAAQARLWVVSQEGQADPAWLYFADTWGSDQLDLVRQLHLQYLYVDERLATQLPHVGTYFHPGETPVPQQLTTGELTKWTGVPGITVAYRHGPVMIYDLSGLGVGPRTTGWTGTRAPPGLPLQAGIGLLAGVAVLAISRPRRTAGLRRRLRRLGRALGPVLGLAVGLAALCVVSVLALLAHVWTGPVTFATLAAVVLLVHRRQVVEVLRRLVATGRSRATSRPRVRSAAVALVVLALLVAVAAVVLALDSAWLADVSAVRQILGSSTARGGGA